MVAKRRIDRRAVRADPQRRDRFQHGKIGAAAAVLRDALTASDAELETRGLLEIGDRSIDEGRLADSGLARDEADPPPPARCLAEPGADLGALPLSADDPWRGRNRIESVAHRRRGVQLRDEAIAAPRDRFDEAGSRPLVPECRTQLSNGYPDHVLGDRDAAPHRIEQRLLGHELTGPL